MSSPRPSSFDMPSGTTLSEAPRVLLVDDNRAILDRAALVLSPGCQIVGAVTDGIAALEAAAALRPDVIVLDISMPGMCGLDVAMRLRDSGSKSAVVFLPVHEDEEVVRAARAAGGVGYVLKPRLASDLLNAALEASAGHAFVSSEVAAGIW